MYTEPASTEFYTLSLHDALPISVHRGAGSRGVVVERAGDRERRRPFRCALYAGAVLLRLRSLRAARRRAPGRAPPAERLPPRAVQESGSPAPGGGAVAACVTGAADRPRIRRDAAAAPGGRAGRALFRRERAERRRDRGRVSPSQRRGLSQSLRGLRAVAD